jgi:hypothetical protein
MEKESKLLDTLLNELTPTQELIELNKHYQKLDRLCNMYLEIEEILESIDPNMTIEPQDGAFQHVYKKFGLISVLHMRLLLTNHKKFSFSKK